MKLKQFIGYALATILLAAAFSTPVRGVSTLPDRIEVCEGQDVKLNIDQPFIVERGRAVSTSNQSSAGLYGNSTVKKAKISVKLFGIIPVKTSSVIVYPERRLEVCGQPIGVAMYIKGALVIGMNEIMTKDGPINPSKDAGIHIGDIIISMNGTEIMDSVQMSKFVAQSKGKTIKLLLERRGKQLKLDIKAAKDTANSVYRLGLWVRDSTAGVGTLTFYDPLTKKFGALGHPICDVDTGTILNVREGQIFQCDVLDIKKGLKGEPGELKGAFGPDSDIYGMIKKNCEYGLFGKITEPLKSSVYKTPLLIGSKSSVHTGKATILCSLGKEGVQEFDIEIVHLNSQAISEDKNMIIRITDNELLDKTNGIVQGMSGSPIIQDGRLVGAVTHVFISDPTRGYGIFIDKMIETLDNVS